MKIDHYLYYNCANNCPIKVEKNLYGVTYSSCKDYGCDKFYGCNNCYFEGSTQCYDCIYRYSDPERIALSEIDALILFYESDHIQEYSYRSVIDELRTLKDHLIDIFKDLNNGEEIIIEQYKGELDNE